LSRAPFARRVAKEISGWRQKKDSLVISLNGDWGSGKTSLKTFIRASIVAECEAAKMSAPAVVEFNPWQWSGQNRLLEAFFDEIGAVFRKGEVDNKITSAKLARFWEGLKVVTIATREVATQVREAVVTVAALLAGGSGVAATIVKSPLAQAWWSVGSLFLIGLSALCGTVPAVADALAALFKWKSEKKKPTLEQVRSSLWKELEGIKSPVLVVIDDIDRLTKLEVRLLMQLVKANANFPNVVYLLLYQKDIVSKALDEVAGASGADFLKKIVQIELEVPAAPEHKLREIFVTGLERIWKRGEYRWDVAQNERFRKLFEDAVWPFFATPRDVKRFLSVYEFYYEGHLNEGTLEVNPIDLVLVETLRMFDPQAYGEVASAFQKQRSVFMELLFEIKEAKESFVAGFEELIDKRELDDRAKRRLRALLYGLFPQAAEGGPSHGEDWDPDLRICHATHFPKYFQLVATPGDVPAALVNKLAAVDADRGKARILLEESIQGGSFIALLQRLHIVRDDLPDRVIETIVGALFDVSDRLPEMKPQMAFPGDVEREVGRLAVFLLKRVADVATREAILMRILATTDAVSAPVFCVALLEPRDEPGQPKEEEVVGPATLAAAKSELLPRMWNVAKSGRLWSLRLAAMIIYRLRDWAGIQDVTAWINEAIKDPKIAVLFLVEMLQSSNMNGGWHSGGRTVFYLLGQRMEEMTDLKLLLASAEKAAATELAKAAVTGLRQVLELKAANKPYAEIYLLTQTTDGTFVRDPRWAR
jgi:hypothetical protein